MGCTEDQGEEGVDGALRSSGDTKEQCGRDTEDQHGDWGALRSSVRGPWLEVREEAAGTPVRHRLTRGVNRKPLEDTCGVVTCQNCVLTGSLWPPLSSPS